MHKLFLPFISTNTGRPQYGVVVLDGTDPGVPYYNYTCVLCPRTGGGQYFPMIFDSRHRYGVPGPACAGKPLLLGNEPEGREQGNDTPAQGAALLYEWRNWTGKLYGFGTTHTDTGWNWFNQMIAAYTATYGLPLPLTGIHMHAYSFYNQRAADFARWRVLADEHGWDIIVTEIGLFPIGTTMQADIARQLPEIMDMAIKELRPGIVFWFALTVGEGANMGDGFTWTRTALYEGTQETVVGAAWRAYTGWQYTR